MEKPFERVLIVMFENQYRNYVMQTPFMQKLATAGADMMNYFGAFHPSQTNYIASLAGEVCATTVDIPPANPLMQRTLVDLMEEQGISWKAYMEAYPGQDWNPAWTNPNYDPTLEPITEAPAAPLMPRYFRKHNAFASFYSTQQSQARWEKIVSDAVFWQDVNANTLPQYAWFTPDIWNDGHYLYNTSVDTNPRTQLIPQISNWLEYTFFGNLKPGSVAIDGLTVDYPVGLNLDIDTLLLDPASTWKSSRVPPGTLIVITFDEADFNAHSYNTNYDGPNQIYTVLLGDMIPGGIQVLDPLNHYSLIRTIEKNFGLGDLGKNDAAANYFRFLWKEKFVWQTSNGIPDVQPVQLAAVCAGGTYTVLGSDSSGAITRHDLTNGTWTSSPTGLTTIGTFVAAALDAEIVLVFNTASGLQSAILKPDGSAPVVSALGIPQCDSLAMTAYLDLADNLTKAMLCYCGSDSFIRYAIYTDGLWQFPTDGVGQITDGPMALAQFGGSLYLTYKDWRRAEMRYSSFNVAPFNSFKALAYDGSLAPENDTSLHKWSPADMPVGHFARKLDAVQKDYHSLGAMAMASIRGEMHLVFRDEYNNAAWDTVFGQTGIFTASSPETNGWGTIRQAGWTLPLPLATVNPGSANPMAMASDGNGLLLVWCSSAGPGISAMQGGYVRG